MEVRYLHTMVRVLDLDATMRLFGLLGLALADAFVAMIKVALERRAEREDERVGGVARPLPTPPARPSG